MKFTLPRWIVRHPRFPEIPLAPVAVDETRALRAQLDQEVQKRAILEREVANRPAIVKGRKIPGEGFAIVLPFAERDLWLTLRLVNWWRLLGCQMQGLTLILACPLAVPDEVLVQLKKDVETMGWEEVVVVRPAFDLPDENWPTGSCWTFLHVAQWCLRERMDYFWCEPDCVALKSTWAHDLRNAFDACAKPFLGHLELERPEQGYPNHMTGCGCYTWETGRIYGGDKLGEAFDINLGPAVYPLAQQTPLIHHVYNEPGTNDPPHFRTLSDLQRISDQAVVFHRNKDGRLMELLKERQ